MFDHLDFLRPRADPTPPVHRARVFLDTRDLINCFEKGRPIGADELGVTFRRAQARLIVTVTTMSELFPGAGVPTPEDVERGIALARHLDRIPHGFIRNSTIPAQELRAAFRAWQQDNRKEVDNVDPFVNRFYQTTWEPAPGTTDLLLDTNVTRSLDRMSVWDQVRALAAYPESLRWDNKYAKRAAEALEEDRAAYGSKRGTREAREGAVKRHLIQAGMAEPRGGLPKFVRWVHENPEVCPGWRVGWDAWEEYRSNVTSPLDPGDLRDFSHIAAIPYVTHFTTDAKWRDLLDRAWKRRVKDGLRAPFCERVFSDLGAVLKSLT